MHREFLPGRKIFRCARNPLLLVQSIAQDLSLKRDDNFVFSCGCAALCLTWRSRNQRLPFRHFPVISTAGRDLMHRDFYRVGRFFAVREIRCSSSNQSPRISPSSEMTTLFLVVAVPRYA
uniref:Uncharacterized protein n=1 Tax=Candidatus Kentrum sp. TUN TaxID=2126343 RepID=A0A450ZLP2_9GAMM|nr:MAG: hypothetical protein BECKTUN1418F_GA0071002_105013 [Candidatus Kentron sp. TUN]